tara:strand:- start:797 stop:988 length:192 start_codon:yes stop_codon:yes gene_type:complete
MGTPPNVKAFSVSLPGVELEDIDDPNTQVASSRSDTSSSGPSDYMPILLLFFALLMLLLMVVR